jgi:hypothetical protein
VGQQRIGWRAINESVQEEPRFKSRLPFILRWSDIARRFGVRSRRALASRQSFAQRRLKFIRFESVWPRSALVSDFAAAINQIKSIGPGSVCALRGIAKLIQNRWNVNSQLADASSRHCGSFVFIPWAGKDHFVAEIILRLPNVAGMRFGDVDDQKPHLAPILLV